MKIPRLHIFKRLLIGFVLLTIVLFALMTAAFWSFERADDAGRWSTHTYQVLIETHGMTDSLSEVSTGAHGYGLTHDRRFLQLLRSGTADFLLHWSETKRLTTDNPPQQARLEQLHRLYLSWNRLYVQPLLTAQPGSANSTAERQWETELASTGKSYTGSMHSLLAKITSTESRLLQQRTQRASRLRSWTRIALLSGGGFAALLAVTLLTLLVRNTQHLANTNLELEQEIAERGRAQEALRHSSRENELLAAAVANLTTGVLITDPNQPDNPLIFVNAAFTNITGFTAAEVLGRNCRFLQGPDTSSTTTQEIREAIAARRPFQGLLLNYRKDGTSFWNGLAINPVLDGGGNSINFVGLLNDVTERQQAERALYQARQHADASRAEAERANKAKSEFLSRMSHELRTPLNAILGFGQLLEMAELAPQHQQAVEHILRGGRHLLDLINEVLDIARIESGQMQLSTEPVAAAEVLRETLDLVSPLAAARGIEIAITGENLEPGDGFVRADRQRLRQILLNLLSNAVKYNRDNGVVRAGLQPVGGERLRILVSDAGPGIAPERMERLFVPFDRLGAEQTKIEGTGLGLALSKHLVEAMGGTMGVESRVGEGSTFWIELPVMEAPQVPVTLHKVVSFPEMADGAPKAGLRPRTLLCIEDNTSNLHLIQTILRQRPEIQLLSAGEGLGGLALAREHVPDLILLDLHLPDSHGHDILLRLRAEPATRNIPIVVLSADATAGQVARLLSAGANGYLTKPLDVRKFWEVVDKTIRAAEGASETTR